MASWIKMPVDYFARVAAAVLQRPICDPWKLDLAATAWCREHSRDGVIPSSELARLASWAKDGPSPESVAESLCEAGLWCSDGDSYRLETYSRQAVPPEISATRSTAGSAGNKVRWDNYRKTRKVSQRVAKIAMRGEEKRREEKRGDPDQDPDSEREARDAPGSPSPSASSPDLVPESGTRKRQRAPKAPKEPKPKRENHPNYQACQDAIDQAYKRATGGVGPDWTNSRERQAVHALCPAWSAAEVEARANRFWVQKMPRFLWDGRVTIPSVMDFRSNFGRLAIAAASIPSDNLPTDDYYGVHPAWRSNGSH